MCCVVVNTTDRLAGPVLCGGEHYRLAGWLAGWLALCCVVVNTTGWLAGCVLCGGEHYRLTGWLCAVWW